MCFNPSDGGAHVALDGKKNYRRPKLGTPYIIQVVGKSLTGNLRFGVIYPDVPFSQYFNTHREKIIDLLPGVNWPRIISTGKEAAEVSWMEGKRQYRYGLVLTPQRELHALPKEPRVLQSTGHKIIFSVSDLGRISI